MSKFLDIAVEAAKETGKILLESFGKESNFSFKSDSELVTEVDTKAEEKIREIIFKNFPDHNILGEEGGKDLENKSEYLWIVDPLEGTVNYSRGIKLFSISIALAKGKDVILGVVYNPLFDELFVAEKGQGATLNGEKIGISKEDDLYKSVVYCTELYKTKNLVVNLVDKVKNFRITSSSAYETALVGAGRIDAFIKVTTRPWGFAAGNLISEEAGARVTNFDGTPWNVDSTHILTSNGILHEEILGLLKSV